MDGLGCIDIISEWMYVCMYVCVCVCECECVGCVCASLLSFLTLYISNIDACYKLSYRARSSVSLTFGHPFFVSSNIFVNTLYITV